MLLYELKIQEVSMDLKMIMFLCVHLLELQLTG